MMLSDVILDSLFPPTCIECGTDGEWWCESCLNQIELIRGSLCPRCGMMELGQPDQNCSGEWSFRSLSIVSSYANVGVRELLTSFKYKRGLCLRESIKRLLERYRASYRSTWPWAGLSELTVTSVPMDEQRLRERGMDHAAELAQIVREILVPWATYASLLTRHHHVKQNAHFQDPRLRRANVQGIFSVPQKPPASVLLVDDVMTSGATLSEATNVLHEAGVEDVHILTIARGG